MAKSLKNSLKKQHKQAASKKVYYSIFDVVPAADGSDNEWDVLFFISGDKKDVDQASPITHKDLKKILSPYFKGEKDPPYFQDEASRNMYPARVQSQERAERLASELVYIFEQAGFAPMMDDARRYKPLAPQKTLKP